MTLSYKNSDLIQVKVGTYDRIRQTAKRRSRHLNSRVTSEREEAKRKEAHPRYFGTQFNSHVLFWYSDAAAPYRRIAALQQELHRTRERNHKMAVELSWWSHNIAFNLGIKKEEFA